MKKLILFLLFLVSIPCFAQRTNIRCQSATATEACLVVYDNSGNVILSVSPSGVVVNQGSFIVNGPWLVTSFPPSNPLSVSPGGTSEFGMDSNFQFGWSINSSSVYDLPLNPIGIRDCGNTTSCANTQIANGQVIKGTLALAAGTATLSGITGFTSSSTFSCVANDVTTRTNAVNAIPQTASTVLFTGTSTDTISYQCSGN